MKRLFSLVLTATLIFTQSGVSAFAESIDIKSEIVKLDSSDDIEIIDYEGQNESIDNEIIIDDEESEEIVEVADDLVGATPSSGNACGLDWSLDSQGKLTIAGTCTENINNYSLPWQSIVDEGFASSVKNVYCNFDPDGHELISLFYGLSNCESISFGPNFDTAEVPSMVQMFQDCSSLEELDLHAFDTSSVQFMNSMFVGCSSLKTLDLSSFDTKKVKSMERMFLDCNALESVNLSTFVTLNVEDMNSMFFGCKSLKTLDVSHFNTIKVTDMSDMFLDCELLETIDVSKFNTSSVIYMDGMFTNCHKVKKLDVTGFDTSSVYNMEEMFWNCSALEELDVTGFNTAGVWNMSHMFEGTNLKVIDVSNFNTSNVTNMECMFATVNRGPEQIIFYAKEDEDLTGAVDSIPLFNTSNVTNMRDMFGSNNNLKDLDLSGFDMRNVTDTNQMLNGVYKLEELKTPKYLPANSNLLPTLPKTMFLDGDKTQPHTKMDVEGASLSDKIIRKSNYATINGRGKAQLGTVIKDNSGNVLKNTDIEYYFTENNIKVSENKIAHSDDNGFIILESGEYANTDPTSTITVHHELVAHLSYEKNGQNVLSNMQPKLIIDVEPLSFAQNWSMSSKASIEASIGPEVGVTVGPLKAKASVASAKANNEIGTTLDLTHEYANGQRNIEIGQEFNSKVGVNGSIGPKAEAKAGVNFEGKLASAEAGVSLGAKTRVAKTIDDYKPSENALELGEFLLCTAAIGSGNAMVLALCMAIDDDIFNKISAGGDLSVEAGASVGGISLKKGDEDLAEGAIGKVDYGTVYSYSETCDLTDYKVEKEMSKQSELDLKALSVNTDLPIAGNVEASVFSNDIALKDYTITASVGGRKDDRFLEVKELAGLGVTTRPSDDDNLFNAKLDIMDVEKEAYDILRYEGDEYEQLTSRGGALKNFATDMTCLYFFDSALGDVNEDIRKAGVGAEYSQEVDETINFAHSFDLGLKAGLGLEGGLTFAGTQQTSYIGQSGDFYTYRDDNRKNVTLVVPTAVNNVEEEILNNDLTITSICVEAVTAISEKTSEFVVEKVSGIKETLENGFCKVKAWVGEAFNKDWKIKIACVNDENYQISKGGSVSCLDKDLSDIKPISYTISTVGDNDLVGNAGDVMSGEALTVGSPYSICVTEADGETLVEDFSEAPLSITLEYVDSMLEAAGISAEDEQNIEVFRYDEAQMAYVSVGGVVDAAKNAVSVDGITTNGQYILAVNKEAVDDGNGGDGDSSIEPEKPQFLDEYKKLSDTEYVLNLATKEKYLIPELAKTKADGKDYKISYADKTYSVFAAMNNKGLINAKKEGVSKIILQRGGKNINITVNVFNPAFSYADPKIKYFVTNLDEQIVPKYDNKHIKAVFSIDKSSEKKGTAVIDKDTGKLTPKKMGTVTVTATVGEGKNARKVSTKVKIYDPAIYVKTPEVTVNKSISLKIKGGVSKPATKWSIVSGAECADLTAKGKLTGKLPGKVVVEALNNGRTMQQTITVNPEPVKK